MIKFPKKKWFHFLVWTMMIVYLSVAPTLYANFILKNGKPLQDHKELPVYADQVEFAIDGLETIVYKGEDIYKLTGWGFSTVDQSVSPEEYEREIVLISDSDIYFFPIYQEIQRPDIQNAFSNLGMDLTYSGFNALIAKEAIKPGKYRLGIVFRNPSNGSVHYYENPTRYVIRKPNNLILQ